MTTFYNANGDSAYVVDVRLSATSSYFQWSKYSSTGTHQFTVLTNFINIIQSRNLVISNPVKLKNDSRGNVYMMISQITETNITISKGATTLLELTVDPIMTYLIKFSTTGTILWNTKFQGRGDELTVDKNNNVVVLGNFTAVQGGTTEFLAYNAGSGTPQTFLFNTIRQEEVFVAKYSSLGQVQWVVNKNNILFSFVENVGIETDAGGNILIGTVVTQTNNGRVNSLVIGMDQNGGNDTFTWFEALEFRIRGLNWGKDGDIWVSGYLPSQSIPGAERSITIVDQTGQRYQNNQITNTYLTFRYNPLTVTIEVFLNDDPIQTRLKELNDFWYVTAFALEGPEVSIPLEDFKGFVLSN
jgi:hypothetical protein